MTTREQAKAIADKVLSLSKADETQLSLNGGIVNNLRFARNTPSTSGSAGDSELSISCTFGKRSGSVTINQFDDATLTSAVRRAEEMARLAPEDPEHMPVLGSQTFPAVDGFSQDTADKGAERSVDGVALSIENARNAGLVAAGFTETAAGFSCIASSAGLFGYHQATKAYLSQTVRTADGTGSGWASASSHRIGDIDFVGVSRTAIDKAKMSAAPKPLAPGKYVTILEPACVANLVAMMSFSMNARRADEGRSFFSAPKGGNRLGEKLFGDQVTLRSDPQDARVPGSPWGGGGLPQKPRSWIDKGVLKTFITDRYWAQKTGQEPVPFPSNVLMSGGQGTIADLVASTERGVLVTSLWYIRGVDPRSMLFTGLTRDGVFWIENGKISHPVQNFRWNDSPISVLSNIEAMSAPLRIPPRPWRATNFMVPALKVKEFHFSSVSDAV